MALISRISPTHSIAQFRRAARLRFAEASRAVEAGDRLVGIDLAGYAAEMILKAAYFRLVGRMSADPFTYSDLQQAKNLAVKTYGIAWSPGNLHHLIHWAEFLIEVRTASGKTYPTRLATALIAQTTRLYRNWRESLRYHENRPRTHEVDQVFQAVLWLFDNESRLTR